MNFTLNAAPFYQLFPQILSKSYINKMLNTDQILKELIIFLKATVMTSRNHQLQKSYLLRILT